MKANITPIDPTLKAFRKHRTAVSNFAGINAYSTTATPSEALIEVWAVEEHRPLDLSLLEKRILSGSTYSNFPCSIGVDTGHGFKSHGTVTGRFKFEPFPSGKILKATTKFRTSANALALSSDLSSQASENLSAAIMSEVHKAQKASIDKQAKQLLEGSKHPATGLLSHKLFSQSKSARIANTKNKTSAYNMPINVGMLRRVSGHLRALINSHAAFDVLHNVVNRVPDLCVGNAPYVEEYQIKYKGEDMRAMFESGAPLIPDPDNWRGLALPEEFHFADQIMAGISPECNAGRYTVRQYERALVRLFKRRQMFGTTEAKTEDRESLYLSALNITLNFLQDVLGHCEAGQRFASMLAPLTVLFYVDLWRQDPVKVAACISHAITRSILADFQAWHFHHPKQETVYGLPLHPELDNIQIIEYQAGQKVELHNIGSVSPVKLSRAYKPPKDMFYTPLRFTASEIAPNVLIETKCY
ncbi:hypothetical protein [Vibrio phage D4]|nr:hypothetical protein [Vibrio phage D4]